MIAALAEKENVAALAWRRCTLCPFPRLRGKAGMGARQVAVPSAFPGAGHVNRAG